MCVTPMPTLPRQLLLHKPFLQQKQQQLEIRYTSRLKYSVTMSQQDQGPTNVDRNLSIEEEADDPVLAAALQLSMQQSPTSSANTTAVEKMDVDEEPVKAKEEPLVQEKAAAAAVETSTPTTGTCVACDDEGNGKKKKKKKKSKKRCWMDGCNAKLKLTDMECKCKHRFCAKHRMMEQHQCEYLKNTSNKDIYLAKMQGLGGGSFTKLETM